MASDNTVPTPSTPPAPPTDQLGAGGQPTIAPAAKPAALNVPEDHPVWQRVKDFMEMPDEQYQKKYAADDKAIQDKVNTVVSHVVPAFKEATQAQPEIEKTKVGKQLGEAVRGQLAHPEQLVMTGELGGPEGEEALGAVKGAAKEVVKKAENVISPHITFENAGGIERRSPQSMGRTGGPFGRAVDAAYSVGRKYAPELTPEPEIAPQGGHAGGGVSSVEELNRPGRFVKISKSGMPTDQNKVPDFNLKPGEAGYQVMPDGTHKLVDGSETPSTKAGIDSYKREYFKGKQGATVSPDVQFSANAEMHPALKSVSDAYRVSDVDKSSKYEPSFIRPDGQAIYLGQDWHPDAIKKAEGYKPTEEDRTRYINDTGAIRVRPQMDQREGETFHITVPEKGVTPEQVDALRKTAATLGGSGNLVFETASKPSEIRTNADRPENWQYKGASDVEPILGKMGALPDQSVNLSKAYGDTGNYLGGQIEARLPKGVDPRQRFIENIGVTHGPNLLDIPQDYLAQGSTKQSVVNHELGHAIVAHLTGIPTEGSEILSHFHPDLHDSTAAAALHLPYEKIPGTVKGPRGIHFPQKTLQEFWPKFLPTYMAGGVAEELTGGPKLHENEGISTDLAHLHKIGKMMGFTRDQVSDMIDAGAGQARELLSHKGTLDVLKQASAEREEGLSKTLHMSADKVQDTLQKVTEARNAKTEEGTIAEGSRDENGGIVSKPEPRTAGAGEEGNVRGGNGEAVQGGLLEKIREDNAAFKAKQQSVQGRLFNKGKEEPTTFLSKAAQEYNQVHGLPKINPEPVEPDERQSEIADAYKAAVHAPNNPAVKASYDALKRDIDQQYDLAQKLGIKMDVKPENPYGLSTEVPAHEELHNDILKNKHLSVWSGGAPPADHPLSAIDPKTGLTYNDKFRMVHDIFGHAKEKTDFSPAGEESAWQQHRQMFSEAAKPALATETRGQAAYTYKYGDFPPQKAALLPEKYQVRPEDLWTRKAADMMDKSEAGAINPRTGKPDVEGKVGTEIYPEGRGEKLLDHRPTEQDLQSFYDKNKEVFDKHPELRIGWDHTDKGWELNVGASGTREGATAVGERLGQRAVWDIDKGEEIPTGGTGAQTKFPGYSLEQRLQDLKSTESKRAVTSPESQRTLTPILEARKTPDQPSSPLSTVPLIKNPLEVKGTGEEGALTTFDVAKALNKFSKNAAGRAELNKAEPEEMVKRAKDAMLDEAKYQLAQSNTGEHWYTKEMDQHDAILREMRPELNDPAKMSLFKMNEAIMSAGNKPYQNLQAALKGWDMYQKMGEFSPLNPETPSGSWGPRGVKAYGSAVESLNRLVKDKGEQGASDWLLQKHPVKELHEYMAPTQSRVRGKATDLRSGALIFGPKRGPFALNLHGQEAEFTADMWVSRTWNRLMGTMEFEPSTGEITTDAPRNAQERDLMRQSFHSVANELGKSTSALQAIMWYYEQALYRAHGIPKESWSFSDAAKRVQDEEKYGVSEVRSSDKETKHGGQMRMFGPEEQQHGYKELSPGLAALASGGDKY